MTPSRLSRASRYSGMVSQGPGEAGFEGFEGDGLDAGEEAGEGVLVVVMGGGKGEAAVANNDGSSSVGSRSRCRGGPRRPGRHSGSGCR